MIRARLLGVLTAVVFIGTAIPASATIAAGGPEPELHLQTDVLTPGQSVAITGSGWPTGSTLQAVLCGANAVDGSTDCAQAAAATMSPGPNGVVDGVLRVLSPPQPCPCVVVVSSLAAAKSITFPVQVVGMPTAPVRSASPQYQPQPLTVRARVTGANSLGSAFGGAASRTLELTVTNTGQSSVPNPVVSAGWGRKGNADHLITAPAVGPLAPGQTRRISIPFELDALSFGSYHVAGRVTGTSAPVHFQQKTSTWPWGLFIVAVVVLLLMLRRLWNVLRRRMAARKARKRAASAPASTEATRWEAEERSDGAARGREQTADVVTMPDGAGWQDEDGSDDDWVAADDDAGAAENLPERDSPEIHWEQPAMVPSDDADDRP
ncbi:MAG TPA: hypothetical protein VKH36_08060 [Acidimicrobiia bacterium]|nr:hypothetical protein [Acidimicrobiia bacterium]